MFDTETERRAITELRNAKAKRNELRKQLHSALRVPNNAVKRHYRETALQGVCKCPKDKMQQCAKRIGVVNCIGCYALHEIAHNIAKQESIIQIANGIIIDCKKARRNHTA